MGYLLHSYDRKDGTVKIEVAEYKGSAFLSVRKYFTDSTGAERPTKAGVTIPLDQIENVREALRRGAGVLGVATAPHPETIAAAQELAQVIELYPGDGDDAA